ncbi:hypothetical protein RFI_36678, partial [Reticulomyxa filosa]
AKVVKLLQRMLLQYSESQRVKQYLFAVISSNMDNDVAGALRLFHLECTFGESIHLFDVEEELYTKQLSLFLHDKSSRKPFIQLYESNNIGMGKTWKIQADIEEYQEECKIEKICVRFNSSAIDWKWIVNTFWQYHPCKFDHTLEDNVNNIRKKKNQTTSPEDTLVIYHLDISSCINEDMNDFLFQLLYLQHIDTDCSSFHVNPNMAFFIEIPSQFDSLKGDAKDILYTLFPKSNFPTITVSKSNNPFYFGKEAQYCVKWIKELDEISKSANSGFWGWFSSSSRISPETSDIDPDIINDLSREDMISFMESSFEQLSHPLNYTILFKFLFTQFKILANSKYLTNKQQFQYKQEATKYATAIAQELFTNTSIKEDDTQFCLCRKLNRSESFYLINHDGSLSLLVPNEDEVNKKMREDLIQANIVFISWKEETKKMRDLFFRVMSMHFFL